MSFKAFSTPHCHPLSLDSGATPAAFAKREVELGSGSITCTDHGSLAAAYEVTKLAKKHNLLPCVGLEAYVRDDNCPILGSLGVAKTDTIPKGMDKEAWLAEHPDGSYFEYSKYQHLTLGFRDYAAYLTGVRLLSDADARAERHGSELKPLFAWDQIEELASKNVTATSSCLIGMVGRFLLEHNNEDAAEAYFDRLNHLFKGRFYVEVFPHECTHNWTNKVFLEVEAPEGKRRLPFHTGKKLRTNRNEPKGISAEDLAAVFKGGGYQTLHEICHYRKWEALPAPVKLLSVERIEGFIENECDPYGNTDVQINVNKFVLRLAEKYNVPVLPSDDSHLATPDEKSVQDVRLAQQGDWRFHKAYYRMSSDDAYPYFRDKLGISPKQFESWIDNSHEWAQGFKGFKFDGTPSLPKKFYPSDTLAHLKALIQKHGKFPRGDKRYVERLKKEIEMVHRNGKIDLLPYFFSAEECTRLYSNQGMLTGFARGSAGGLLISYLLDITQLDPIRYELSMERFLTTDRVLSGKLPDIDQDLTSRELLVGQETEVVEFEAEDGTLHILPEWFKVETDQGLMTVREAKEKDADVYPWWLEKEIDENQENPPG